MKETALVVLAFALAASTFSFAQGRGAHGRPATTGIERAETVANSHGDKGLDNAEAKQNKHKKDQSKKHKPAKSHRGSAN